MMAYDRLATDDCAALLQLADETRRGVNQACGEQDELTREVGSLHSILTRLHAEFVDPASRANRASIERRQELEENASECRRVLKVVNSIIIKYNALGRGREGRRLWQKIRFGNGELADLSEIKLRLLASTYAIKMGLNLCALYTSGPAEGTLRSLELVAEAQFGGIRKAIHWAIGSLAAGAFAERAGWAQPTTVNVSFWRVLRRELVQEGYSRAIIKRYNHLIKAYVQELALHGVFDDLEDLERTNAVPTSLTPTIIDVTHFEDRVIVDAAVEVPEEPGPEGLLEHADGSADADKSTALPSVTALSSTFASDGDDPLPSATTSSVKDGIAAVDDTGWLATPSPDPCQSELSSSRPRSPFSVQLEEVTDEAFLSDNSYELFSQDSAIVPSSSSDESLSDLDVLDDVESFSAITDIDEPSIPSTPEDASETGLAFISESLPSLTDDMSAARESSGNPLPKIDATPTDFGVAGDHVAAPLVASPCDESLVTPHEDEPVVITQNIAGQDLLQVEELPLSVSINHEASSEAATDSAFVTTEAAIAFVTEPGLEDERPGLVSADASPAIAEDLTPEPVHDSRPLQTEPDLTANLSTDDATLPESPTTSSNPEVFPEAQALTCPLEPELDCRPKVRRRSTTPKQVRFAVVIDQECTPFDAPPLNLRFDLPRRIRPAARYSRTLPSSRFFQDGH